MFIKRSVLSLVNYLLFLLLIALGFVTWAYPAYLWACVRGKENPRAIFQAVTARVFRLFFYLSPLIKRVEVENLEHLLGTPPLIITPSHRSFLDYILVASYLRGFVIFTNKAFSQVWPLKYVAGLLGVRYKGGGHSLFGKFNQLAQIDRALLAKESVLIFPEGTRGSAGQELLPFHEGAFKLAVRHGVAVIPVAILGAERIHPRGGWVAINDTPEVIRISIGAPLFPEEGETPRALADRTRIEIMQIERARAL